MGSTDGQHPSRPQKVRDGSGTFLVPIPRHTDFVTGHKISRLITAGQRMRLKNSLSTPDDVSESTTHREPALSCTPRHLHGLTRHSRTLSGSQGESRTGQGRRLARFVWGFCNRRHWKHHLFTHNLKHNLAILLQKAKKRYHTKPSQ